MSEITGAVQSEFGGIVILTVRWIEPVTVEEFPLVEMMVQREKRDCDRLLLSQNEAVFLRDSLNKLTDREEWTCAARQVLRGTSDCDWPVCGCDPYANKVMETLDEAGMLGFPAPLARDSGSDPQGEKPKALRAKPRRAARSEAEGIAR